MDPTEILYLHYHQDLVEQDRMRAYMKALGILWDRYEVKEANLRDSDESDEIMIPLALAINPKILDLVKKERSNKPMKRTYGDGTPIEGEVKSLGDLTKEDFYRMIGQPMPSALPKEQKEEMKKKWSKTNTQG